MGAIQDEEIGNSWSRYNNFFWKDSSQLLEKNRDGIKTVNLKMRFLDGQHQHYLGTCSKCKMWDLTWPTEWEILRGGSQNYMTTTIIRGFPGGTSGKEPTCQHKRCKRLGFDPWVGKIRWRRAWQPTPVFLPGESHGQRSLAGYSPWGLRESDATKAT